MIPVSHLVYVAGRQGRHPCLGRHGQPRVRNRHLVGMGTMMTCAPAPLLARKLANLLEEPHAATWTPPKSRNFPNLPIAVGSQFRVQAAGMNQPATPEMDRGWRRLPERKVLDSAAAAAFWPKRWPGWGAEVTGIDLAEKAAQGRPNCTCLNPDRRSITA